MAKAKLTIEIWTRGRRKLPLDLGDAFEPHVEHVAQMVRDGFVCGQIVDEKFSGWWNIENVENARKST
jgi:hypothetical protein